jgi:hypothetical protein
VWRMTQTPWPTKAVRAIRRTCLLRKTFISDDVWKTGKLSSTFDDRALGAAFKQARELGYCVKTDRCRPSDGNRCVKPVWRSRLFK